MKFAQKKCLAPNVLMGGQTPIKNLMEGQNLRKNAKIYSAQGVKKNRGYYGAAKKPYKL